MAPLSGVGAIVTGVSTYRSCLHSFDLALCRYGCNALVILIAHNLLIGKANRESFLSYFIPQQKLYVDDGAHHKILLQCTQSFRIKQMITAESRRTGAHWRAMVAQSRRDSRWT
jgi:hypothetical protein